MNRSMPGLPVHHHLLDSTQTHVRWVMTFSHLIPCRPLLLLPPIPPSIRVFSNESSLHMRWPKYWSFSFSISPSKEHLGLIYFRMNWLDLLAVQGTLKSLLQHHSSKASIVQRSAFFTVQLSHPCKSTRVTLVPLVTLFLHVQVQPSSLPTLTLDDDSAIEMAKVAIMEISRNSKIFLFQSTTRLQRKDIETYFEQWTMCPAC